MHQWVNRYKSNKKNYFSHKRIQEKFIKLLQLREFYTTVVYLNNLKESQEYKECLQLLTFLSKQELLSKLNSLIAIIASSKDSDMIKVKKDLQSFEKRIDESSLEVAEKPIDIVSTGERLSRLQLKEV